MKSKKLTACLMALIMVWGAVSTQITIAADESEQEQILMDMNLVRKLNSLGILKEDPEADYGGEVTRANLAKIVVQWMGYEQLPKEQTDTRTFLDVPPSHPAWQEIQLLYHLGYISGSGNRMFEPDRAATCSEAMAMLLNAVGYRGFAMSMGGFDRGYLILAQQNDLLDGLKLAGSDTLTLRDIYVMLDNSLEMPVCVQTGFGDDTEYVVKKDSTLLQEYHEIRQSDGLVTGNGLTRLSEPTPLDSDEKIEIDHVVFDTPGNRFGAMLGMQVEYYVKENNDGDDAVVYMEEQKNRNNAVEIAARDIIKADNTSIEYWGKSGAGKKKSISVNPNVYVIYNGRSFAGYGTLDRVMPTNGKVICLSNDGGDIADVLIVTDYQNIVVRGVDKDDEIIYDKDGSRGYDLNKKDYDVKLYGPDGKDMELSQLQDWDVVAFMVSKNKTGRLLKSGYVTRTTVSGQISEKNAEGNRLHLVISGQEYPCADGLTGTLVIGMNGTYYLNYDGEIVAFQAGDVSGTMYAILVAKKAKPSFSDPVKLKLFTQDGVMKEYVAADKVEIDGRQYTTEALAENGGETLPADGSLIRYRLKENDKVSFIDSGRSGNEGDLTLLCTGSNIKIRYNIVSGKAVISDNTIIFGMPKKLPAEDTEFNILTPKTFAEAIAYSNTEYGAYNLGNSEIGMASAMYVKGMKSGTHISDSAFGVVTSIANGIDDEDNPVKMLYMMRGGVMLKFPVKDEALLEGRETASGRSAGIQPGDVVRVGTDALGMIYEIETIFNFDGSPDDGATLAIGRTVDTNTATFDAYYRAVYGTMESLEGDYMRFSTGEGEDKSYGICNVANASIMKYYNDNKTADSVGRGDITRGDKFVMRLQSASARDIIILK